MLRLRSLGALVAPLGCVVIIAACGSASTTSTASAGASAGTAAGTPARAKLRACLKAHGVTLPVRPNGRGPGGPGAGGGAPGAGIYGAPPAGARRGAFGGPGANPKFRTAIQACGGQFGARRVSPTLRKAAITRFVACVKQHGYRLPTPNLSGTAAIFPAKIQSNPKFRAAVRPCQGLLFRPRPVSGG